MKYKNKKKYFDQGGYGNKPKRPENDLINPEEPLEVIHYIPVEYYHPESEEFYYYDNDPRPRRFSKEQLDPREHVDLRESEYPPENGFYSPENIYYPGHPEFPGHPNEQFYPEDYYRHHHAEHPESPKKRMGKLVINTNKRTLKEGRPLLEFNKKIEHLDDLIELSKEIENNDFTNIALNQEHLLNLQEPLIKLKNLIGMESIKRNIFSQLVFFLQNIEPQHPHMLHTCIEGPPGCGKTELANILAQIYANLGIIKESKVIIARRSDLVAGFLGQTAQKTQDLIDSAKGGVLLIDEAYSLGNEDKKDSFAKECIDTLNQNLTEGKGDFICIIAGYKEDLEKSFFGFNSGLERRFPYRFSIDEYTANELCKIFQFILEKNNWKIDREKESQFSEFLRENRENFKFNGGDLENLVHFSKLAYAKNRVINPKNQDKIIRLDDMKTAYEMYLSNKKKEIKPMEPPNFMYN